MSELNIQSHLRKLKEDEKNKLEEIRQKKLGEDIISFWIYQILSSRTR